MRVPDQAEVVVLESLRGCEVSRVLLVLMVLVLLVLMVLLVLLLVHRRVGERVSVSVPREVSRGARIVGGARAALKFWARVVEGVRVRVRVRVRALRRGDARQRAEDRLGQHARLQEGEYARVFGVLGLRALHRGEVVHEVLHALAVAEVEVTGELREQLTWGRGRAR